jgi:DNA-binding MarR family transcriptional regulator
VTGRDGRPGDDTETLLKPGDAENKSAARQTTFVDLQARIDLIGVEIEVIDKPNRAVPQWAIDALVFGAPEHTSARKIWGRLLRIAMSAQARGWTRTDFINEVTKVELRKHGTRNKRVTRHELWIQLMACSRSDLDAYKQLDRAWQYGIQNRANQGLRNSEDLVADAVERAYAWEDRLTEGKDGLSDSQALVIHYVATFVCKRRLGRVTCPSREVSDFTGIPHTTVARILKQLTEKGFLVQFSKGAYNRDPKYRRAAIYGLSDPFSLVYGGRGGLRRKAEARPPYVPEQHSEVREHLGRKGVCVWGQGMVPLQVVHRSTSPCPMYHAADDVGW